jgi:flagellar basal-body rod protein FlgB
MLLSGQRHRFGSSPVRASLDNLFGIHEQALLLRERRAELLAENLANADTPEYKARDVDFRSVLAATEGTAPDKAARVSHPRHIRVAWGGGEDFNEVQFRVPTQPAIDGNTVDPDTERGAFLDNSLRYQASLQFIERRIRSLLSALRGE